MNNHSRRIAVVNNKEKLRSTPIIIIIIQRQFTAIVHRAATCADVDAEDPANGAPPVDVAFKVCRSTLLATNEANSLCNICRTWVSFVGICNVNANVFASKVSSRAITAPCTPDSRKFSAYCPKPINSNHRITRSFDQTSTSATKNTKLIYLQKKCVTPLIYSIPLSSFSHDIRRSSSNFRS